MVILEIDPPYLVTLLTRLPFSAQLPLSSVIVSRYLYYNLVKYTLLCTIFVRWRMKHRPVF